MEYRGHGFWSLDDYLEHLLALLADRIGESPNEKWLVDLRDHWRTQSSGDFHGWIHPKLDEFVTSDDRRDAVLTFLDGTTLQPDIPREARETAKLFEALLRGQITTDASSPLDYMVSGSQPYRWSVNEQAVEQRDKSDERIAR